jgi:pimeloyl-ACP methyl ester carboxylesterase
MQIGVTTYRGEGVTTRAEVDSQKSQVTPLVLIHGFPVDHRMWDSAAHEVVARTDADLGLSKIPVFAFEMPGAGTTPVPSSGDFGDIADDGAYPQALDAMAAAFVDKLHAMGFGKAIWVGLSMGGYAVLAIQRLFPDAVAGLGICDSKPDADSPQARANRLHVAQQAEEGAGWRTVVHFAEPMPDDSAVKKSPEFIRTFTTWIHEQSAEGIAWRQRMAAGRPEQEDVLPTITAPTLLLSGSRDPSSPPAKMRPYLDKIAPAFFVEIADAGHFTAVEQPGKVADALVELCLLVDSAGNSR